MVTVICRPSALPAMKRNKTYITSLLHVRAAQEASNIADSRRLIGMPTVN